MKGTINMSLKDEKPLPVYIKPELRKKLDDEADRDGRSATKQIVYFIEEQIRIREWNRKATKDRG